MECLLLANSGMVFCIRIVFPFCLFLGLNSEVGVEKKATDFGVRFSGVIGFEVIEDIMVIGRVGFYVLKSEERMRVGGVWRDW